MQAFAIFFAVLVTLGTIAMVMLRIVLPYFIDREVEASGIKPLIEQVRKDQPDEVVADVWKNRLADAENDTALRIVLIDMLYSYGVEASKVRTAVKGDTNWISAEYGKADERLHGRMIVLRDARGVRSVPAKE